MNFETTMLLYWNLAVGFALWNAWVLRKQVIPSLLFLFKELNLKLVVQPGRELLLYLPVSRREALKIETELWVVRNWIASLDRDFAEVRPVIYGTDGALRVSVANHTELLKLLQEVSAGVLQTLIVDHSSPNTVLAAVAASKISNFTIDHRRGL